MRGVASNELKKDIREFINCSNVDIRNWMR